MAKRNEKGTSGEVQIDTIQTTEGPAVVFHGRPTVPAVFPSIYRQMAEVAAAFAVAGLAKNRTNEQQRFKFRGIDDLLNLAAPILAENSLLVLPRVRNRTVETRETRSGGQMYHVSVDVEFTFVSALDGSNHTVRVIGEAMDAGDKATNKAMSAAYKYCLFQSFCIPIEGSQDEADVTTPPETVVPKPEHYDEVKQMAQAHAVEGEAALKIFAKALKGTPGFAAYEHLVKFDPDWAGIKAVAAKVTKADEPKITPIPAGAAVK